MSRHRRHDRWEAETARPKRAPTPVALTRRRDDGGYAYFTDDGYKAVVNGTRWAVTGPGLPEPHYVAHLSDALDVVREARDEEES